MSKGKGTKKKKAPEIYTGPTIIGQEPPPMPKASCPVHGEIDLADAIKVSDLGELDGDYCVACIIQHLKDAGAMTQLEIKGA